MMVAEKLDVYSSAFEGFARERTGDPAWLRELRAAAIARFTERGFPTTRDEEWRHTNVGPVARTAFRRAEGNGRVVGRDLAARAGGAALRAVFVDGLFSAELSALHGLPQGATVTSLGEALRRGPERLQPHLARIAGPSASAFADLNAAFLEDGAFVSLAPGVAVEEPIHLLFLSTGDGDTPVASFPRNLVLAGRGSQARVVETYSGVEGKTYLCCPVTEVVLEADSGVDHYKLQREGASGFHVATLAVSQGRDSRFVDHHLSLGAALSRTDIAVRLGAEGGECALDGLFLADGERLTDTHTRIDHVAPHCTSRELYKGIVDGRGRGVFHGRIVVRPGAQKTDAYQTNKNLLLSKEALVDSTPQLEIFADDVKCKHGSTTGQLDPNALFYLRARGIPEAAARTLLTWAFASELVHRLEVPSLRAAVEEHLQARLPGAGAMREAVV
jgi:Fe-S cluster assembly protein SufD